jgi:uncharacterized protein (TIGR03086 family)
MSEISERYRRVAGQFTARVNAVPAAAWDNPAPCDGWVARDVVGHLVEWVPGFFFGMWDLPPLSGPSVEDDPAAAWAELDAALEAALDDPEVAPSERDTPMGRMSFEATLDMICTTDVLVHTWDLARATGLDETLDAEEVHRYVEGMEPIDQMLRESGQYGPRVPVAPDADEQTRLIGFLGRQP